MKKVMQKTKAAAAANNIHTHPLKGGGVIFAACSTREGEGQKTKRLTPRDSRSKAEKPTNAWLDRQKQTPRNCAQWPLPRVETSAEGQHTRSTNYVSDCEARISDLGETELAKVHARGSRDWRRHRTLHAPAHEMELRTGRLAGFLAWRTSFSACSFTWVTTTWVFRACAAAASGGRAARLSR